MPLANRFRHQPYSEQAPTSPYHLLQAPSSQTPEGDDFRSRMLQVGDRYREAGVAAIYLVHGTFVGPDALGILEELARFYPAARQALGQVTKKLIDSIARDAGNYTGQYAKQLEQSLNAPGKKRLPVRRFHWSSQNNHIGRADGGIRLIDEIASHELGPTDRVMLWGHSHAGNVFALMSNLLASDDETLHKFFDASRVYYRWPLLGFVDIPVWRRTRLALLRANQPLIGSPLDMVTFGAPIRYGWDSAGYSKLLHFISHRPREGEPAHRAPFPPSVDDVMTAADGDYVQQLGIAGTNLMPSLFSWRSFLADRRLHEFLQPELPRRKLLERFQTGARVPQEGTTLLVDYGPAEGNLASHVAGHAVYTRDEWMLFHAEQVAARLYGPSQDPLAVGSSVSSLSASPEGS